jgi:hypothetical protein
VTLASVGCITEHEGNREIARTVGRRSCQRASASSDHDTKLSETAEDERRDHRTLADRRGNALRRAMPHIAGGKQADTAGLQRERIAI